MLHAAITGLPVGGKSKEDKSSRKAPLFLKAENQFVVPAPVSTYFPARIPRLKNPSPNVSSHRLANGLDFPRSFDPSQDFTNQLRGEKIRTCWKVFLTPSLPSRLSLDLPVLFSISSGVCTPPIFRTLMALVWPVLKKPPAAPGGVSPLLPQTVLF